MKHVGLCVLAVALFLLVGCSKNDDRGGGGPPEPVTTADAEKTPPDHQKIAGRWLRPDGGYVLVLEDVSDGELKASYFNPSPIPVVEGKWAAEGSELHVFVKFEHPNYPGSYYYLVYDPDQDRLRGAYYQAVTDRTYNVEFVRQQ